MKYKEVIKTKYKKIGYSLVNLKDGIAVVSGEYNALVVRNKVSDFDYKKGYTPAEVGFEEILFIIFEHQGYYAFDNETLKIFLQNFKITLPEIYEASKLEELENWKPEEDVKNKVLITIGQDNLKNNLNYN